MLTRDSNDFVTKPPPLVAIVEDDEAVLSGVCFYLAADGYQTLGYADASHALDSVDLNRVDCFVIDFGLPDRDGLDLLASLRARGVNAPAVLVTSQPSPVCVRAAQAAGVPIVEKPLDGGALAQQIRALMESAPPPRRSRA